MYAVILAGGGGTRLWPLSDPAHPKPFLPLFEDGSLLQKTRRRLTAGTELHLTDADLTVVTDLRYEALVSEQLPDVGLLTEPLGRNTAAAIALAAWTIERPENEVMVVLPADHLITDEAGFRGMIASAARLANGAFGIDTPIVTLGAQPTGPSTQYGYLVPDRSRGIGGLLVAYPLERFEEKPNADRATGLLEMPGVAWNAGIFIARRRAFLDALGRYTELLDAIGPVAKDPKALAKAYEGIKPISIDYAVMEPAAAAGHVVMAAMNVGWSDVGTWGALLDALVASDGGYSGAAKVVQAGEAVTLGNDDVAVVRDAEGRLAMEQGPKRVESEGPIGYLPDARRRGFAVQRLVDRVNESVGGTVVASA